MGVKDPFREECLELRRLLVTDRLPVPRLLLRRLGEEPTEDLGRGDGPNEGESEWKTRLGHETGVLT